LASNSATRALKARICRAGFDLRMLGQHQGDQVIAGEVDE
jgi:hypothetical protein